ncbi:MAG: hypothetical protein SP4CHLAM5_07040 [Chlamydiia bacterium]|nr:hypothetical protein [Chlamydiia bacterium]MCH9618571.1 hypothetical protein [Chlamydiia bacterium]MCH9623890.1 hypothetical protein [Chlamydiia bacterium]
MNVNRVLDFAAGSSVATMVAFAPKCYQEFTGKSDTFSARVVVVISLISAVALSFITRIQSDDGFQYILDHVKVQHYPYLQNNYRYLQQDYKYLHEQYGDLADKANVAITQLNAAIKCKKSLIRKNSKYKERVGFMSKQLAHFYMMGRLNYQLAIPYSQLKILVRHYNMTYGSLSDQAILEHIRLYGLQEGVAEVLVTKIPILSVREGFYQLYTHHMSIECAKSCFIEVKKCLKEVERQDAAITRAYNANHPCRDGRPLYYA